MNHAAVAVLKFRNYRLSDKDDYVFPDVYDLPTVRQEFLNQYYLQNGDIPPRILIDEAFDGDTLLSEYLSEKLGRKVSILVPRRAIRKRWLRWRFRMQRKSSPSRSCAQEERVAALDELAKLLGLKKPPAYIEAYDISNLGESAKVGGMVVFENGRPLKKAYKKFKIREVEGQDDYSSMREVLTRRLTHYMEEKDSGEGFGRLPGSDPAGRRQGSCCGDSPGNCAVPSGHSGIRHGQGFAPPHARHRKRRRRDRHFR